jgi:hypothetical protein
VLSGLSITALFIGWGAISWRVSNETLSNSNYVTIQSSSVSSQKPHISVVTAEAGSPDPVNSFNVKLLRLILEKSGHPYTLTVYTHSFNQDNLVRALKTTENIPLTAVEKINVAVLGAATDINNTLLRIPIPVTGGLLGMRVGIAHRQFLPLLSKVNDLNDLSQLSLIQGTGWRDVDILDASRLKVYTARPNQLLQITESGQAHLFLRGVTELKNELSNANQKTKNVVLDPFLIILYPFAGFFYVNPDNTNLAYLIEEGFMAAIQDGSYQDLLASELLTPSFRSMLKLRDRKVIYLDNPDIQSSLDGVDEGLWLLPWTSLSTGRLSTGEALCSIKSLALLCKDHKKLRQPNSFSKELTPSIKAVQKVMP